VAISIAITFILTIQTSIKPPIQEVNGGPTNLNVSVKHIYDALVDPSPKSEEFLYSSSAWVDVRDLALAHVLALQKKDAGGERIIVSAGMVDSHSYMKVTD
jgi:hypothetical protein